MTNLIHSQKWRIQWIVQSLEITKLNNNKALDLKQLVALFGQTEYLSPSLTSQHTADICSERTMTKPKKRENPNFKPIFFENNKS